MIMLTKSLEFYNTLNRKGNIRAGASIEGLRNHTVPKPNSVASLNQHEIWYEEPTPILIMIKDIPLDLEVLEMTSSLDLD